LVQGLPIVRFRFLVQEADWPFLDASARPDASTVSVGLVWDRSLLNAVVGEMALPGSWACARHIKSAASRVFFSPRHFFRARFVESVWRAQQGAAVRGEKHW
jgi:hypothetical protein